MAVATLRDFVRQTSALTKKNLVLLTTRHWLSTLLQSIVAPIVILALTLSIRDFTKATQRYGLGTPRTVHAIQNIIPSSQQLVLVKPPSLGPDVTTVIDRIAAPFPADKVRRFESPSEASRHCTANFRGVSNCYAIITFYDSPLTLSGSRDETWNYTMQFDPVRNAGYRFSVHTDRNGLQVYHLPVQVAVENAITNNNQELREWGFTSQTQADMDALNDALYSRWVITVFVIVFYLSTIPAIYHIVSFVSGERAGGTAELVDAMGGFPSARVFGTILALSAVQFPMWLISGCLYWYKLFPKSNAAIPIFWQIFSGLAFLNAAVFGAAFFKRRIISSIFVGICFLCLGGGAAILLNRDVNTASALPLSLLFPQMNYIFVLSHMARFAYADLPIDMSSTIIKPDERLGWDDIPGGKYDVAVWTFWVFLIVQIFVYPVLAIMAERFLHGINFKGRTLAGNSDDSAFAIKATGLAKVYNKKMKALDGVDLVAQKHQVLCLLGVNGAGKSTTLDLLSGAQAPTAGSITINARHPQLGVCPQRNVMFDRLTVFEHVKFWRDLKGGDEDRQALHDLIAACDLTKKTHSQAGTLSGGQKRKLQLACMFVGNTTVCLMDEVTSGLDPISRRTIWNIILAERSKRSMVFTTHFLDEGEVLADHIIILSKGQIKCQGTGTELKNQLGGGYRVSLPREAIVAGMDGISGTAHQDRMLYTTPDSRAAAQLVAKLEASGQHDVQIAGPTVEDVFLRVAQDDVASSDEPMDKELRAADNSDKHVARGPLSTGQRASFFQQLRALMMKRLQVLPRYWTGAFLVLAIPIACMPAINTFIPRDISRPACSGLNADYTWVVPISLNGGYGLLSGSRNTIPFGPRSYSDALVEVLQEYPVAQSSGPYSQRLNLSSFGLDLGNLPLLETYQQFERFVGRAHGRETWSPVAVWMGDADHPATIAYVGDWGATSTLMPAVNLYSSVRSRVKIAAALEERYFFGGDYGDASWQYILYAAFILAIYPCFFALYPAFERVSKVRSLQISNGVRPLPMLAAYFLFDFCFVLAISIAYTATITAQFGSLWMGPSYMFPIVLFHGVTGILISYIASIWASSQLAAFLWALGYNAISYFGLALSYTLPSILSDAMDVERNTDIISYTLNLFFPIGNVFRAQAVGWNLYRLACRNDALQSPASWYGYGFPITYLVLQMFLFAALLVFLDNDLLFSLFPKRFARRPSDNHTSSPLDTTVAATPVSAGINNKKLQPSATASEEDSSSHHHHQPDLLHISHLSKSFHSVPAVQDVSLSLTEGEIVSLLGPNGAGKTTIVNMVRGELQPDSGAIFLRGQDISSHKSLAQHSAIGVCPQFDALDLLTARQHLNFYAAIKGIPPAERASNIANVMARVGLTPHASKLASKLSGGNKRKLSLAIALMGNPSVLILDEPSSSMDAAAKRKMWKILSDISPGRSLLLTTHSMEEADALATRAAILSSGKLLALGTTQTLRKEYSDLVCVQLVLRSAPHSSPEELWAVEDWVRSQFGAGTVFEGKSLGGQVRFMVPNSSHSSSSSSSIASTVVVAPTAGSEAEGEAVSNTEEGGMNKKGSGSGSGVGRLIELLEENREVLGLQDYSIGAPTLERVFLAVVRDNYSDEEDAKKVSLWRRVLGRGGQGKKGAVGVAS